MEIIRTIKRFIPWLLFVAIYLCGDIFGMPEGWTHSSFIFVSVIVLVVINVVNYIANRYMLNKFSRKQAEVSERRIRYQQEYASQRKA